MAHLRHKQSGELKEVQTQSAEYHELAGERDEETGKTVWEDAGVRAHAELGIAPADLSGINDRDDRDYEDMIGADDPSPDEVQRHSRHEPEGTVDSKYSTMNDASGSSDPGATGASERKQQKSSRAAAEAEATGAKSA